MVAVSWLLIGTHCNVIGNDARGSLIGSSSWPYSLYDCDRMHEITATFHFRVSSKINAWREISPCISKSYGPIGFPYISFFRGNAVVVPILRNPKSLSSGLNDPFFFIKLSSDQVKNSAVYSSIS